MMNLSHAINRNRGISPRPGWRQPVATTFSLPDAASSMKPPPPSLRHSSFAGLNPQPQSDPVKPSQTNRTPNPMPCLITRNLCPTNQGNPTPDLTPAACHMPPSNPACRAVVQRRRVQPSPTQSNRVQPSQTMHWGWRQPVAPPFPAAGHPKLNEASLHPIRHSSFVIGPNSLSAFIFQPRSLCS